MRLNRILGISAGVLTSLLGLQLVLLVQQAPRETHHAIWVNNPNNLAEGQQLASQIVRGRVIDITRGQDIVVKTPGEPEGVDRIPTEIVTLALEGSYKGQSRQSVQVFRTGVVPVDIRGLKPTPRPRDGMHGGQPIPAKPPSRFNASQVSNVSLDDDPPYRIGEEYIMYLRGGPILRDARGRSVRTMRMVNPALRLQVTRGRLQPAAAHRAYARELSGKSVSVLASKLPPFRALPFKQQAPQLQRLKLEELQRRGQTQEYNRLLQQLPSQQLRRLQKQPLRQR
jgi:hypothetical protein